MKVVGMQVADSLEAFSIPVPEPDLTPDDLVARAEALRPMLRDKQAETEMNGAPPLEIHEAIAKAGLYRVIQPRRFGGYEFPLCELVRVSIEVARGCPSTGWYYSFSAGHALLLAEFFPERTQAEVFGPDGDFYAPGRLPMGTAVPVEGGWKINGRWDYCSGAPHANYFVPALMIPPADDLTGAPTDIGLAVVPRSQWAMLDDWRDVFGLRGSGSNSIRIENQVVPEHFLVRANFLNVDLSKPTPGYQLHGNALYAGRVQSALHTEIAATAVGAAFAMLDEYAETISTRETYTPPIIPRVQHHHYQRIYGMALGKISSAQAIVLETARQHGVLAARGMSGGAHFTPQEEMILIARYQHALEMVFEAVDMMWRTAGTSAARAGSRMLRYFRDFAMLRTHLSQQFDMFAEGLAAAELGVATSNPRAAQSREVMESRQRKFIDKPGEATTEPPPARAAITA